MHDCRIIEWEIRLMITNAHQLRVDKYLFLYHDSHVKIILCTIHIHPEKVLCYYVLI